MSELNDLIDTPYCHHSSQDEMTRPEPATAKILTLYLPNKLLLHIDSPQVCVHKKNVCSDKMCHPYSIAIHVSHYIDQPAESY